MESVRALATLRRRLAARRRMRELVVPIPGARRPYVIAAPADPDAVLDEVASAVAAEAAAAMAIGAAPAAGTAGGSVAEPHMPYWATPWASGLALAQVALDRQRLLAGRRVLELGCGLGTTACAVLEAGARLAAADCYSESLAYCRYNGLRNAGRAPRTILADWRTVEGAARLRRLAPFDAVLAADVLYEPDDIAPLLSLLPALVRPGGRFWLAEPGRATSKRFVDRAQSEGWSAEREVMDRDWAGGAGHARVTIHLYQFR